MSMMPPKTVPIGYWLQKDSKSPPGELEARETTNPSPESALEMMSLLEMVVAPRYAKKTVSVSVEMLFQMNGPMPRALEMFLPDRTSLTASGFE